MKAVLIVLLVIYVSTFVILWILYSVRRKRRRSPFHHEDRENIETIYPIVDVVTIIIRIVILVIFCLMVDNWPTRFFIFGLGGTAQALVCYFQTNGRCADYAEGLEGLKYSFGFLIGEIGIPVILFAIILFGFGYIRDDSKTQKREIIQLTDSVGPTSLLGSIHYYTVNNNGIFCYYYEDGPNNIKQNVISSENTNVVVHYIKEDETPYVRLYYSVYAIRGLWTKEKHPCRRLFKRTRLDSAEFYVPEGSIVTGVELNGT